jgi:16S rRNA (adenine1518-N6/adenine1519-N6)-dimethyltransferase
VPGRGGGRADGGSGGSGGGGSGGGGGASSVKRRLEELGLRPRKGLGQHFLVDGGVLGRQLAAARLGPEDTVLEVGAGLGTLTVELARRAGHVVAYEADARLAAALGPELPANVRLLAEDALDADWPPFTRFVANVPYGISSPLLFKLLDRGFGLAVVLLQREFADRLAAVPRTKDYGRLTVACARVAGAEVLEVVPPSAFWPQPRVESALVRLTPRDGFAVADREVFDELLRTVFSQRRKMLRNSLGGARGRLAPRSSMEGWLEFVAGVEWSSSRPEELAPAELGRLADDIAALGEGVRRTERRK